MNHNYSLKYENLLLRPLHEEDIEALRNWRNDPDATRFLRPIGYISVEMQKRWFNTYLQNPQEIAFAIVETQEINRIIGSLAIYNFAGDTAEIGKLQIGAPEALGCGFGSKSLAMAAYVAFSEMGLKRIITSVHRENLASYKSFTKLGFQKVGSHASVVGGIEDDLEIWVSDFEKENNELYR